MQWHLANFLVSFIPHWWLIVNSSPSGMSHLKSMTARDNLCTSHFSAWQSGFQEWFMCLVILPFFMLSTHVPASNIIMSNVTSCSQSFKNLLKSFLLTATPTCTSMNSSLLICYSLDLIPNPLFVSLSTIIYFSCFFVIIWL